MTRSLVMAAMIGAIATVPAQAQDRSPATVRVHYRPAELRAAEGRAALQRRLIDASNRVCRFDSVSGSLLPSDQEIACRRQALAQAKADAQRVIAEANQGRQLASRDQ